MRFLKVVLFGLLAVGICATGAQALASTNPKPTPTQNPAPPTGSNPGCSGYLDPIDPCPALTVHRATFQEASFNILTIKSLTPKTDAPMLIASPMPSQGPDSDSNDTLGQIIYGCIMGNGWCYTNGS